MNSISYLTNKVEGALHPGDLDPVIPKENTAAQPTPLDEKPAPTPTKKHRIAFKEDSSIPYIFQIILFVPNILIVRPLLFFWFIFTFPLSLLESGKKQGDDSSDQAEDEEPEQANTSNDKQRKRASTTTIMELDEDEKLETTEPDNATATDLIKSPTSPSTMGILAHNAKLFTFPRSVYPSTVRGIRKTLILDLDETLVHSVSRGTRLASSAYPVEIKLRNQVATLYYVQKRPYCDMFLKQVSKWYNLVIFTASVKEYADPVIDLLETERKYFSGRYYRNHCTLREGQGYIKDLTSVDKSLNHVIIIDNSPISYALHEDNAIAVEGWISDSTDTDLLNLIPVLHALRFTTDVRSVLSLKNGEAGFEM